LVPGDFSCDAQMWVLSSRLLAYVFLVVYLTVKDVVLDTLLLSNDCALIGQRGSTLGGLVPFAGPLRATTQHGTAVEIEERDA